MAEVTKDYADQVLKALEAKGNDMKMVGQELDRMDANEQKQFFADAGSRLGLSLAEPSGSAVQAFKEKASGARFEPDQVGGPGKAYSGQPSIMPSGKQEHPYIEAAASGLSTAGAIAGGTLGSIVNPGTAIGGAAIGGGMGQAAENEIKRWLGSDEPIGSIPTAIITSAAIEAGGQALAPVLKVAGQVLKKGARAIGSTTIPTGSVLERYSSQGLERLANLLEDWGVINTPGTNRTVTKKLGKAVSDVGKGVEQGFKAIDKASGVKVSGDQIVDQGMKSWEESFPKWNKGATPNKAEIASARKILETEFPSNETFTHEQIWRQGRKLEGNLFKGTADLAPKNAKLVGVSLRDTNSKLASMSSSEEVQALIPQVRETQKDFAVLAMAQTALKKTQKTAASPLGKLVKFTTQTTAGSSGAAIGAKTGGLIGGVAGAAVGAGAGALATSTLGKTSAITALSAGSKVLSKLAENASNPVAKRLMIIASREGLDKMLKTHAYLMVNNNAYHDMMAGTTSPEAVQPESQ